jgi:hypothetical protein
MAKAQGPQVIDVRQFKGVNTVDDPIALDPGESPAVLNMDITKTGAMQTRFGYELVSTAPGTSPMRGALAYYKTYDDVPGPTDQSQDAGHIYANTYTVPNAVSETATNKCTFTPVKTKILRIGLWVVAKGTGSIVLELHDAANNILANPIIENAGLTAGAWNYFLIEYKWTSGPLHFHLLDMTLSGSVTVQTNVASDLSTASYIETYSTANDYLLLFTGGNIYSVTNDNFTPNLIGIWGTDNGDMVRGVTFNNWAIFGQGGQNPVRYWDATTLGNIGSVNGNIFGTFAMRLFLAGNIEAPYNVYYSKPNDPTDWADASAGFLSVNLGDGQKVTAFSDNNDSMQIFKENSTYAMNFSYDSSYDLTNPNLQKVVQENSGSIASGTTCPLYGYTYHLSKFGFNSYGPTQQRIVADQPVPLSMKIDPTILSMNWAIRSKFNSTFFDNKFITTLALGTEPFNNYQLIYNENIKRRFGFDNWTVYKGVPALSYTTFRDSTGRDRNYFVSYSEPKLYRFNTTFSDDGFGYDRGWKSKTFQFGERTKWMYIDIEGSMTENATIFCDLNTDDVQVSGIIINKQNLISSSIGAGYVGDNYIGDSYVGGAEAGETVQMYRFKARINFPANVNYGYNMWFQLRNQAEGEGWKLSRYRLVYESDPDTPTYSRTDTYGNST